MSALPPKADIGGAIRYVRFVPRADMTLFILITLSAHEKRLRNDEANRLRGVQIDDQLEPRWLLDRQAIFPQRRVCEN